MLLALAAVAFGSTPVISASGGWDLPIAQPWAGVEVGLVPVQDHGFEPIGRLALQYGPIDTLPFGTLELGGVARVPEDEAVLRAGLVLRLQALYADFRVPMQLSDPEDGPALGFVPGFQGLVEFAWKPEAPLTLGFRAGPQSSVSDAF